MIDKLSIKIKQHVKGVIQFTILLCLYHCILDDFFMNTIFCNIFEIDNEYIKSSFWHGWFLKLVISMDKTISFTSRHTYSWYCYDFVFYKHQNYFSLNIEYLTKLKTILLIEYVIDYISVFTGNLRTKFSPYNFKYQIIGLPP